MPPAPDRIIGLARAALTAVENHFGAALPERRYVSDGLIAFDCEQLAVQVERTFGQGGNIAGEQIEPLSASAGFAMRAATLAIWLLHCAPVVGDDGSPPSVTDIEASAEAVLVGAQRLLNALVAAQRAGELAGCHGLAFETWQGVGPDGGLVGGVLRVRVALVSG